MHEYGKRNVRNRGFRGLGLGSMSLALVLSIAGMCLGAAASRADCYSSKGCGNKGQSACKVLQCLPSCASSLLEFNGRCWDSCYSAKGCGKKGQNACVVTQCLPSCDSDLKEFNGKCGTSCHDSFNCGSANNRPCKVTECLPSCRDGLYEDFSRKQCLKAPAGFTVQGATMQSVALLLNAATSQCIGAANAVLPIMESSDPPNLRHPVKSTALFAGSNAGRCIEQFDIGYVCGGGAYAAGYFTALSRDINSSNTVLREVFSHWNQPPCNRMVVPTERAICAATFAAEAGARQAGACIRAVVDDVFARAGKSSPPLDGPRIFDQVCQGLGTLTYGLTVDQSLGLLFAEVTGGTSEVAATARDAERVVQWIGRVHTLLKVRDRAVSVADLRGIPQCRGILYD